MGELDVVYDNIVHFALKRFTLALGHYVQRMIQKRRCGIEGNMSGKEGSTKAARSVSRSEDWYGFGPWVSNQRDPCHSGDDPTDKRYSDGGTRGQTSMERFRDVKRNRRVYI